MPEAVIVATAGHPSAGPTRARSRLPAGRPGRADRARGPAKVPRSTRPSGGPDLGCALPGGEAGFNIARVVAILLGLRSPARYHRQPLLLVVAADDPDGHSTPSRPVRATSSFRPGSRRSAGSRAACDGGPTPRTRSSSTAEARTERARPAARPPGTTRARTACPTSTSRWARPPRTSRSTRRVPRGPGRVRRALAAEPGPRRPCKRLLRAGDHPGHPAPTAPSSRGRRPPCRARRWRSWLALKPVFRPDGTVTAGNCLPAQRRRRGGRGDERRQGATSSASRRWPGSWPPG